MYLLWREGMAQTTGWRRHQRRSRGADLTNDRLVSEQHAKLIDLNRTCTAQVKVCTRWGSLHSVSDNSAAQWATEIFYKKLIEVLLFMLSSDKVGKALRVHIYLGFFVFLVCCPVKAARRETKTLFQSTGLSFPAFKLHCRAGGDATVINPLHGVSKFNDFVNACNSSSA